MTLHETLESQIEAVPLSAMESVRNGFSIATALSKEQREVLIKRLISAFQSGVRSFDVKDIIGELHITRKEAADVFNSFLVIVRIFSETAVSVEVFLEAAREKLFDEVDYDAVLQIVSSVSEQRKGLTTSIERANLANETLPSLISFNITVDLRPRFEGDEVIDAVAVALLHINTDTDSQIWLQLNRGNIEKIQEVLNRAHRQIDNIEGLFQKILRRSDNV